MTQVNVQQDKGDPRCLHCVLSFAIAQWAQEHAQKNAAGLPVLDMSAVVANCAKVIGEIVHRAPEERQKLQFERYARECLEASFVHQRTGEAIAVNAGLPPGAH